MESPNLITVDPGFIRLSGLLGRGLDATAANRLAKVDYTLLVDVFRYRMDDDGGWRGEFWGKVIRSAILAWKSTRDENLLSVIRATVKDMLSVQGEDGCISGYSPANQTTNWDIWGRKYVVAGLLRYYEVIEKDPAVLNAAAKVILHMMTQIGPGKINITECGFHDGLAASSILYTVVKLYRFSKDQRFLDYARWIAGTGCSSKHDIFEAAIAGTLPQDIANGKSYEMMSCFLGATELYREVPEEKYLQAVIRFYEMVRDREIYITGVSGLKDCWGEYWFDGKFKQCGDPKEVGTHGETCITTTWIHYCYTVLKLTGSAAVADEIELSLYNGILGGMLPDGSNFIHGNPELTGSETSCKIPADDQILRGFKTPFDGHDCCRAQGPEGLAMAVPTALIGTENGVNLNLFENMSAAFAAPSGQMVKLSVTGDYPLKNQVKIEISLEKSEEFSLKLRIPKFTASNGKIELNGKELPFVAGTYLDIERIWQNGDTVCFDMAYSPVMHQDPGRSGKVAFTYGPLVLAQDNRLNDGKFLPVSDGLLRENPAENFLTQWRCSNGTVLTDYISAGNNFSKDNLLCVWSGFSKQGK